MVSSDRAKSKSASARAIPTYCPSSGLTCEKNGDKLCDTAAEPAMTGLTDAFCNYTGTGKDQWNDTWVPDEYNIMSYAGQGCKDEFSPGQIAVMHWHTVNSYTMAQSIGNNITIDLNETPAGSLTGSSYVCQGQSISLNLSNNNNVMQADNYQFFVTDDEHNIITNAGNLTNGNANGVTFQANNTFTGQITIRADLRRFNDYKTSLYHTVFVGPPSFMGGSTVSGPGNLTVNSSTVYSVPEIPGVSYYRWKVPYGWTIVSGQGTRSARIKAGNTGVKTVECRAENPCGNTGYLYTYVTSQGTSGGGGGSDPCLPTSVEYYPNPLNKGGTLSYAVVLPGGGDPCPQAHIDNEIEVIIIDMLGREVARHQLENNKGNLDLILNEGIYFLKMRVSDSKIIIKKIVSYE